MAFRIGDKVRSKLNNKYVGIIDDINVLYNINTISIRLNDDDMIDHGNPDNWELYFEVGDIVVHKSSGVIYRIYRVHPTTDNNGNRYDLEHFTDVSGERCTRLYTLPDDICLADSDEILEFYKLKESCETSEKLKLSHDVVDALSYIVRDRIITKEKETNDMRNFKIGDRVEHIIYGKGTVMGREYYDLCLRQSMPKFKQVIYNDPATIIFWEDGTKTVVKCDGTRTITLADGTTKTVKTSEGEKYDELKGLMMGIVKKVYGFKKFYDIYEDTTKYVTGNKTLLNIEKGLAESIIKDLYGIKKINSKDDIYKVAMTDGFYVSTERK